MNAKKNNELKKTTRKFIAAIISLVMMITMTVSVSYAWVILSSNPAVSGAQITIAGGTTILIAPDITETVIVDGKEITVHYPGEFNDSVNFAKDGSYAYLASLSGLTPVSTADGISWLSATYDEITGELNSIDKFDVDNTLSKANLTDPSKDGNYIYLDFWVVSPGSDYKLRVSSDVKSGEGTSVLELPGVKEDDKTLTGLSLEDPANNTAASVRVGFLANNQRAADNDTLSYSRSDGFDSRYNKLYGRYQEKGDEPDRVHNSRFTIYEPNGTLHPSGCANNGDYVVTKPLAYDLFTELIYEKNIKDILTVQKNNEWKMFSGDRQFDQIFQAGISGMDGITKENAMYRFFDEYLQWRVAQYITAGKFFSSTDTLYANAVSGRAEAASLETNVGLAGATDDVYITTLERNTPQRIRMFIWLEGQDIDCSATSIGATEFLLNIELAGAST